MEFTIQEMTLDDYEEVFEFWERQPGVGLTESDSREQIGIFLQRNPGLSCVVRDQGRVVGAVLCGHDGRRGFLHHLAVDAAYRKQGVGREIVLCCLQGLKALKILRCNIWVYAKNETGKNFWRAIGFHERLDLQMMQSETDRKAS